jgi:hypothetical protein
MKLNISNGELNLGQWTLHKDIPEIAIKEIFKGIEVENWTSHGKWSSFRLKHIKELIIILHFEDGILNVIELFPEIEDHEKWIQSTIKIFGGEKKYSWGNIKINIDHKASYKSIMIRYI